jgi:hypothetical protein
MADGVGTLVGGAIRLETDRASEEDLRYFLRLFDAAWGHVPPEQRRLIADYWRGGVAPESCRGKPNVKERYDPHVSLYREDR